MIKDNMDTISPIQLTDQQKQDYLKSKIDAFKKELKVVEDKTGMTIIAYLDFQQSGVIPRLAVVSLKPLETINEKNAKPAN